MASPSTLNKTAPRAIPLVDLKRQYLSIKPEIDAAMQRILDETDFIMGKDVKILEESFAQVCGVRYGIGASSGTTALYLALVGLGIGPGDEVITVPNTFIATTEAISQTGARVVFVDIDEKTYNIDVRAIEKAITKKTKAIIPVHLYGQPADMAAIQTIARKKNLKIIEDASQAHLAEFQGRPAGSWSDVACFSFYPGKNLGAYGDAGMVVTDDEPLARQIRMLSDHGRTSKYEYEKEGYNYRIDTLQAAILNVKLKHLGRWTKERQKWAALYDKLLSGLDVVIPGVDPRAKHVYHLYVIRLKDRDRVKAALAEQGISAGIHYPIPLHLQKAYAYLGYKKGTFPIAEQGAQEILSLPMFAELSMSDIEYIVGVLKKCL